MHVAAPEETFLLTYQDWEDVHLVGTEVIVQEVSLSSICHKEAVSERYVRVGADTIISYQTLSPKIPFCHTHTTYAALMGLIENETV